jgi:hypothetical protein
VLFAVNVFEVATPFEFVVSVSVAPGVEVANVPLAPEDGAVNVTETPLAGDPFEVTVALNGDTKAEPTAALCGVPPVAVIAMVAVVPEPPVFVRLKLADFIAPVVVAVTV